jgi:hypothetical protein
METTARGSDNKQQPVDSFDENGALMDNDNYPSKSLE